MKRARRRGRAIAVPMLLATLLTASNGWAATHWCFRSGTTGDQICVPLLQEEVRVKLPPDPGPYQPTDISHVADVLNAILGNTQSKWIALQAIGGRVVAMDLEAEVAVEVGP